MEIDIDIAHGVMNSLNKLYMNKELEDFVVEIDEIEFKWHRVLLGSCSEFFGGLFRSGMKEVNGGRASVQGISVETFQLILNALYTGINVLTKDNVIDIWHASNQLQVQFLIKLCEKSVISWLTLENFEEVFFNAKLIHSEAVLEGARKFMLENFEKVRKTKTFLNLSFIELLRVVEDRDLVVNSEDLVVESSMEWVEQPIIEKFEVDTPPKDNIRITRDTHAIQSNDMLESSTKESQTKSVPCNNNNNEGMKDDEQVSDLEKNQSESHDGTSLNTITDVQPVVITNESAFGGSEGEHFSQGQTDTKENASTFQDGSGTDPKNPDLSNDSGSKLHRERLEKLPKLLAATRTCLASVSLLQSLYKHTLMQSDSCAKDIIFNAVLYHTRYMHGQWPTAALHRKCSEFDHYGVQMKADRTCLAISIFDEKLFNLPLPPGDSHTEVTHLVAFDNELYCCSFSNFYLSNSQLFRFKEKSWTLITQLTGRKFFLLGHEDIMYAINRENREISMINPSDLLRNRNNLSSIPDNGTFENATTVDRKMLVFSTETKDGVEETAVQCWDLVYNTWMRLDSLEGPAKHLISFSHDDNSYILQPNGKLWQISRSEQGIPSFTFLAQLWKSQQILRGAVVYGNKVIIFGDQPEHYPEEETAKVNHLNFKRVRAGNSGSSIVVPVILPKAYATLK